MHKSSVNYILRTAGIKLRRRGRQTSWRSLASRLGVAVVDRDRPTRPGHDLTIPPKTARPEDSKWKSRRQPANQPRSAPRATRDPPESPITNQPRWIRAQAGVSSQGPATPLI